MVEEWSTPPHKIAKSSEMRTNIIYFVLIASVSRLGVSAADIDPLNGFDLEPDFDDAEVWRLCFGPVRVDGD